MVAYGSKRTYGEWVSTTRKFGKKKIHRLGKLKIKSRRNKVTFND